MTKDAGLKNVEKMSNGNQGEHIQVQVIHNYLLSAAREMMRNLKRTAFDTIIYEIQDFGLGIYDRECRLLAESPGLAIFTRGNDFALRKMVEFLGEENIHEGDVILFNYPYWSSNHTLDVLVTSPIFYGDELVGYTACKAHWLDLNQQDPGYCLDTTSIHNEGLILPALKIYKRGVRDQEVENLIMYNTRIPDRVVGNMNAQISCCHTGEKRVQELVEKFGLDAFKTASQEILNHGERIARSRLASLPKGTWSAEDWVDDDGVEKDKMIKIKVTVTVTDDEFIVDFTGTDPAVKGPVNLPIGITEGVSALAFKGLTTPDTPANDGNFRPLRVIAPEGSLVNAQHPAATFTIWPSIHIPEIICKALAPAMPDIVPACSGGEVVSVMGVGTHPVTGKVWLEATNEAVGFGGHAGGDGENAIMHLSEPGCRNNPIEVLENKAPLLIEGYFLRQDSCGAGENRGGVGATRVYRFTAPGSAVTILKKTKTRPWALNDGLEAEANHIILRPGTDREVLTGAVNEPLESGEVLISSAGGGGGWGNPLHRSPEKVLQDVRDGYVSLDSAKRDYGVIIDTGSWTIDYSATSTFRQKRLGDK
ncbi:MULTISPECIES: hydantoinase B/oxoprolinase family protein [Cytobacillus]|uniref:5-oxoprolinase n=1 Tax=Cytobacillus oceanisediminis 2691 TaxID=1196031 RepID=A0A160MC74_9BACI|nr:hydantoinase B/oxoprolinase family protein [Cytobacillus oceanisediminis]AND40559.1 5-oxoprolinase [Cytobacillus oceanisediminis 2691]MCM3243082.1 hydantoinase B/oxoprolinase family protein [Cytobacillus oceanisediminis]MCM3401031.1 hydantoinase B/oxoprolinase family protein [Cytobacillus oceanisediminis]MDK7665324.1 hydantoinase B/oxoprolinase family protein [Cytobacillus oceanisediminis]